MYLIAVNGKKIVIGKVVVISLKSISSFSINVLDSLELVSPMSDDDISSSFDVLTTGFLDTCNRQLDEDVLTFPSDE